MASNGGKKDKDGGKPKGPGGLPSKQPDKKSGGGRDNRPPKQK